MNWRKKNPTCTGSSAMNLLACTWMFSDEHVDTCTRQCVHMGIGCSAMNLLPHVYMAMCTRAHGYSAMKHEQLRVHGCSAMNLLPTCTHGTFSDEPHMTTLSIHRWTFCPRWQLGKGQFSDERFQARWYYYLRDSSAMNFFPKWQFTNELLTSDHIGRLVSSFICPITL